MGYRIVFAKRAQKDAKKIEAAGLKPQAMKLLKVVAENPWQNPPPYEKLVGDLRGMYSRRINITHRLVYAVDQKDKVVKILSMWTHYE